jgi:hypothetical protein
MSLYFPDLIAFTEHAANGDILEMVINCPGLSKVPAKQGLWN